METIKEILMRRDGKTAEEAVEMINNAIEDLESRIENGELPYDICDEHFGLEPDYLDELVKLSQQEVK